MSWVVARVGQDGEVRVTAADRDSPAIEIPTSEQAIALELRGFASPLARLELPLGAVPRATDRQPSALLPDGALTMRATLDGIVAAPWEMGTLDDVARFRRPVSSTCGTITTQVATLPSTGHVEWVASLDRETVLLGTSNEDVILLRDDDPPLTIGVVAPGRARIRSAFADDLRTLWLGDQDGGLWRGRVDRAALTLERAVAPAGLGPIRGIDGDRADPDGQLYVITASGSVARVTGTQLTEVDRFELGLDTGGYSFALAWMGVNDVLHGHSGSAQVHRWQAGISSSEALNPGDGGIIALDRFADGRVVASMGSGQIAVLVRGEPWLRLPRGPFSLDVRGTQAFGRGFLYGGAYGYLGQWVDGEGFCAIQEMPLAAHTVDFIRPLGDRMVVLGETREVFPQTPYLTIRVE